MSTSIAAQPAYLAVPTLRSQAKPDRTIFGTTLDNYKKCRLLLSNPKAIKEANDLHIAKVEAKWAKNKRNNSNINTSKPESPSRPTVSKAWVQRTGKYPQDSREIPGNLSAEVALDSDDLFPKEEEERYGGPLREVASRSDFRGSCFARKSPARSKQFCKSAVLGRNVDRPAPPRLLSAQLNSQASRVTTGKSRKQRGMSSSAKGDVRPLGGSGKVPVPRFRVAPKDCKWMRTASLKITETGAKDLINAKDVNKIGLGESLQYNHEAHKQREFPEFYKAHGDVRILGQHFSGDTTNSDVTAPGGFYRLSTPDREINQRFNGDGGPRSSASGCHGRRATYQRQLELLRRSKKETRDSGVSAESEITEHDIPLNIRHKFGRDEVARILAENKREVKAALRMSSDLRHSGIVPARSDVKELNHPIDPPPAYFDNFGKNLKYDTLEGGLHMYIK